MLVSLPLRVKLPLSSLSKKLLEFAKSSRDLRSLTIDLYPYSFSSSIHSVPLSTPGSIFSTAEAICVAFRDEISIVSAVQFSP